MSSTHYTEAEVGWRPTFSLYVLIFAALVCGPTLAALLAGPQSPAYYAIVAIAMPVALVRIIQNYPDIPRSVTYLVGFAFLPMVAAGLQTLFHTDELGYDPPNLLMAGGMSAALLAAVFCAHLSERDYRSAMHLIALVYFGYCLFGLTQPAAVVAEGQAERFSAGGIGTAVWSEIAFACVASAVASRRWHVIIIALALALPVAVLGQLRGTTIAIVVTALIFIFPRLPRHVPFYLALLAIPAFVLSQPYWDSAAKYLDEALLLSNPTRGITSGFSGRFENWAAGYEAFTKSPLIGASIGDPVIRFTHSAFILAFAELGVVGGLCYIGGIVAAGFLAVRRGDWSSLAVIVGYTLFVATSPRYINFSAAVLIGLAVIARVIASDARDEESAPYRAPERGRRAPPRFQRRTR